MNFENIASHLLPADLKLALQHMRYSFEKKREDCGIRRVWLPNGYERIYHFHIRKTAGSSINAAFRNAFEPFVHGSAKENLLHRREWIVHGGQIYVTHNKYLINRGDYFYGDGHACFEDVDVPERTLKLTIVRDPVKRVISYYRMLKYWQDFDVQHRARGGEEKYLGGSFGEFLELVPPDKLLSQLYMFSKRLSVDDALSNAMKMNFIMTTEKFDSHLSVLSNLVKLKLKVYREKAGYGDVEICDRDMRRLCEYLEPEREFVDKISMFAGRHMNFVSAFS